MKRLLFLSAVSCSVVWALSVQSQTPSSPPPDPSMVYGYIAMVDSVSGARINPSPPNYWFGLTAPITVVFGSVATGEERVVAVEGTVWAVGGSPLAIAGGPHMAFRYQVRLAQDGYADAPVVLNDLPPFKMIRYNPGQWRFRRVEVPPCTVAQRSREGGWTKEVSRRAEPFSDLPDNLP